MSRSRAAEALRILIALAAGLIGARLHTPAVASAASPDRVIRAERVELTDARGRIVAYLGTDRNHASPTLTFLNTNGAQAASIGLIDDGLPFLNLFGTDTKIRLTLRLRGVGQKPAIVMSDSRWEGRTTLGYIEADVPSQSDDDWGLLFRAPQGETAIADLGMIRDAVSGRLSGTLALLDRNGKTWAMPPK